MSHLLFSLCIFLLLTLCLPLSSPSVCISFSLSICLFLSDSLSIYLFVFDYMSVSFSLPASSYLCISLCFKPTSLISRTMPASNKMLLPFSAFEQHYFSSSPSFLSINFFLWGLLTNANYISFSSEISVTKQSASS